MQSPASVVTTRRASTTNDSSKYRGSYVKSYHTPARADSHNLNKYIWRFIALSAAQPRVITIEATNEQEARQQSPDGLRDGIRRPDSSGRCAMCNNTRQDAAAEAIKTLMHALIDISVIADRAHKHATSETEYAGLSFLTHWLLCNLVPIWHRTRLKPSDITHCENGGGVMRDDRF